MGTDIHGGFIKVIKNNQGEIVKKEEIETNWTKDRNYTLFAILAGVRNGFGFAGCYRHEPVNPITKGRGLPSWLEEEQEEYNQYGTCYYGDHSLTHMTLKEILEWNGWKNKLSRGGVLAYEDYIRTVKRGIEPDGWYGNVSGDKVVVLSQDQAISVDFGCYEGKEVYVQCFWESTETLGEMYDYFLEEVKRIYEQEGESVYLVIGFDS